MLGPRLRSLSLSTLVVSAASCGPAGRPAARTPPPAAPAAAVHDVRAIVFRAPGFPTIDAPPIGDTVLAEALRQVPQTPAGSVDELRRRLSDPARAADVLVLPYGSAFPVDAWPEIRAFLAHGGGLAVLGGAPLRVPVYAAGGSWSPAPPAGAFAHAFLFGPAEAIRSEPAWKTAPAAAAGGAIYGAGFAGSTVTWALTLRLTAEKEFPAEHGSAGPRDAVARPLVHLVDASGTPRGCALLEVDRLRGPMAGARWVFATTDAPLGPAVIGAVVARALEGAAELRARPVRASVPRGTAPAIAIELAAPRSGGADAGFELRVVDVSAAPGMPPVFAAAGRLDEWRAKMDTFPLPPGLYRAEVRARGLLAVTGFWVKDEALLAEGPKLTAGRDWLRKDGRVFPVVGTTYMASDVDRHFLFEPNPAVWDADFAAMEQRRIRFVRTGLWTAWSRVMPAPPEADEGVLAALEAFVQTAARHGIVVCFNLFAFLPPAFGGENPYLDPKSLAGQAAFVRALVGRMRGSPWIHWDLINEPSYAPPEKLWRTRPVGDRFEAAAFHAFVRARHGDSEGKLRAIWRAPEPDLWAMPREEDFSQAAVEIDKRPRKVRDFRELVEDVVAAWSRRTADEIRRAAGGPTLVTLGQDEGGLYERPTQQFLGAAGGLDYTSIHTWWKNDDLLWDGVLSKVDGKPSLHQETGLMRLEDLDGAPWRTADAAGRLLERKIGYAFAGRGAGVVEWVWNVNPRMPLDEEATIGLFRPDGTAKPELDVLERFARFFDGLGPELDDFERDPVVLVVPHARAFLGMTGALDATKPVVRALAERFGVVPRAVSDLRLDAAALAGAKLVLVPRPDVLDEPAAQALLEASRAGSLVVVTGAVDGDSYGRPAPSLAALGLGGPSRPVAMREATAWSAHGAVSFDGLLQESARRDVRPSRGAATFPPATRIWHEPLPLEIAREPDALVALLGAALAAAKIETSPDTGGVAGRVLKTPTRALLVVVNERPEPATRRLLVDGRPVDVRVSPLGAAIMLVDRKTLRPIQ